MGSRRETQLSSDVDAAMLGPGPHRLSAAWRFPTSPLVEIRLDDRVLASVDYLPASASAHWFLTMRDADSESPIAVPALASRVPEEVDSDAALQRSVLDESALSAASRLLGRPLDLTFHDA